MALPGSRWIYLSLAAAAALLIAFLQISVRVYPGSWPAHQFYQGKDSTELLRDKATVNMDKIPLALPSDAVKAPEPAQTAPGFGRRCDRWFGSTVGNTVQSKNEAWQWVLHFLESVRNRSLGVNRLARDVETDNLQKLNSSKVGVRPVVAVSVRFPNTTVSKFEEDFYVQYAGYRTDITIVQWPRPECSTGMCTSFTQSDTVQLRRDFSLSGDTNVIFINFRVEDKYDMERILPNVRKVETLVTSITTEPATAYDLDYALELYNLLHKTFFAHDWTPVLTNYTSCQTQRHNCDFWIVWSRWDYKDHSHYLPPAGNGSYHHEIARHREFYLNPCTSACSLHQGFGGQSAQYGYVDGIYTVCLDPLYALSNMDNCLVYSFGVNEDWTFDDSMRRLGCTVHSFDPSLNRTDYRRNTKHWFYSVGLGLPKSKGNWTMMPFEAIRENLNHTGRRISVLKMDIEYGEWDFFASAKLPEYLKNVEQFLVEIHPSYAMHTQPLEEQRVLHNLEKLGFVLFAVRRNPAYPDIRILQSANGNSYLYELSFINLKLLKS